MKIAILHLSDFHILAGERFLSEKIKRFGDSLNILGNVDEYVIVFSGDLANSGKANEYKCSRYIIGQIIYDIKQKNDNKSVDLLMVPGNHDLTLTKESRDSSVIQEAYEKKSIEHNVISEIELLNNYYFYSHANTRVPYDKILERRFCTYNDEYKIQFNLINTSLFSTLKPDDKELHYFPKDKIGLLKKQNEANLCITVMHHSCEWFNWQYQSDLEKAIINSSELLLTGHDHCGKAKNISIDNSMDTWMSCAGEMKFSNIDYEDSFNTILIDTNANTFCGYIFSWDPKEKIYVHKILVDNKHLQSRTSQLIPLPSYLKELKEDTCNHSEDFTKYFVFPKLISEQKNEFSKYVKVLSSEELLNFISTQKRVLISGSSSSGKSTLLKYLYCSIFTSKTPLFLSIDSTTKIKTQNFIKHLFEDQYGDEPVLFEKYQQLEKDKKILIIDGWDRLCSSKIQDNLLTIINENFNYIIISENTTQQSLIDSVKDEINKEHSFHELRIKPFFAEKRNQLVRNICSLNSSYNDEDINKVNKLIDSLVNNNSGLFSLDPGFIIRYTDYFIKDHFYDYTKGEAVFSKIFEHEIQSSIILFTKKADVDEIITTFEELAGYIYTSRNDLLKIGDFSAVIKKYNEDYSVDINANDVLSIGLRSKLLRQTEDLSIYFSNKNYLAYFIAKYLLRLSLSGDMDYSGIEYALHNICFGINSDIILFISYLSSNTRTVMSIANQAGELLSPWEELNYEENNISFMRSLKHNQIKAPTKEDHDNVKIEKERIEEMQYPEEIIEAKGLFQYDEEDIDKFPYRLVRAIKYTEMLCKSLPAFNSMLKRTQKDNLIESIYSYPHKIAFALLKPLDNNIDNLCNELLELAKETGFEKKSGQPFSKDDIIDMINEHSKAIVLSIYDHFAELCTSSKTISLLSEKEVAGTYQRIQKLMIKENSGDTESFLKEADIILKNSKDDQVKNMVKLIVRKHLLCKEMHHSRRQQIIDKYLGEAARKPMLLQSN